LQELMQRGIALLVSQQQADVAVDCSVIHWLYSRRVLCPLLKASHISRLLLAGQCGILYIHPLAASRLDSPCPALLCRLFCLRSLPASASP
jgi:hypothetical protein